MIYAGAGDGQRAAGVWRVACGKGHMTCGVWRVLGGGLQAARETVVACLACFRCCSSARAAVAQCIQSAATRQILAEGFGVSYSETNVVRRLFDWGFIIWKFVGPYSIPIH